MEMPLDPNYLELLKERGKESHVYRDYQLTGLEVAEMLGDRTHKALYMRLAKQYGATALLSVARRISEQKAIKNKGAYFMKVFFSEFGKPKNQKKDESKGSKTNSHHRGKEKRNVSPKENGSV
ncbi:hypothetical protein C4565_04260 [Candidatus Parcubacteria bacterium]|jgi:hypothetical protein|nr:MAG: hypothetical protein C4565_04260 [Candidatus Parcubacteria bacterium]